MTPWAGSRGSWVTPAMTGAFRTPGLRCVALRPSFMHTGQIPTLAEAVTFFSTGGNERGYPGANEIHPLGFTAEQQADLVAFLAALTGPGAPAGLKEAP